MQRVSEVGIRGKRVAATEIPQEVHWLGIARGVGCTETLVPYSEKTAYRVGRIRNGAEF